MKVEIWSDVICPFCYIGKHNFEKALAQFADKDKVEVVWKSFQLDSSMPDVANESYEQYLVKRKGLSVEKVRAMLYNVTQMASQSGLEYHLDRSVMVNSLHAHRLIQYAKLHQKGDEAEERLFEAFFTRGENIADPSTLISIAVEIGLDEAAVQDALSNQQYSFEVNRDIQEARAIGVSGVPFFVFNRKYAISGAQPPQVILETLQKSYSEWQPVSIVEVQDGQSCGVDGRCE